MLVCYICLSNEYDCSWHMPRCGHMSHEKCTQFRLGQHDGKEGPRFGEPDQYSYDQQRPEGTSCSSSLTHYEMHLVCSNQDPSVDVNSMTNFFQA